MRKTLLLICCLLLGACSSDGGDSPSPVPPPDPILPTPPTSADWVKRFVLPSHEPATKTTGDSGEQAFGASRYVESLATMFEAMNDRKFIDRAVANIDAQLATAAKCTFALYPSGSLCWTSARYTTDAKPYPFLLHDGLVLSAIARVVFDVQHWGPNGVLDAPEELQAKARGYLAVLHDQFRHRWDADWKPLAGGGTFVIPAWQTHYAGISAGQSLPFNMSASWALFLYRYSKITGDADARAKALAVGATFRAHLAPKGPGSIWNYAAVLVPVDSQSRYMPVSDTSHANIDVLFVNELAVDAQVFNDSDVARIAYTFTHYTFSPKTHTLHDYIDGADTSSADYGSEVTGFAALARINPQVGAIGFDLLSHSGEAFGSSQLGIAELALYAR